MQKALLKQFVQVVDLEGTVGDFIAQSGAESRIFDFDKHVDAYEDKNIAGQQGRCVDWYEPERKYIVETLDGVLVAIPEANLQAWWPLSPEEGGFDFSWPDFDADEGPEAREDFSLLMCTEIAAKGYCVLQTFLTPQDRQRVLQSGESEDRHFSRMAQELEAAYMGFENDTKIATLNDEITDEDELALEDEKNVEEFAPLRRCDTQVAAVGGFLARFGPSILGVGCGRLQNTLLRMSIDELDEDDVFSDSLLAMMNDPASDADAQGEWGDHVKDYLSFLQCRRVCILFMVQNEGGDLWLYPKEKSGYTTRSTIHIPISCNKLVVFRHDLMDYSYQVKGPSIALQSWTLDGISNTQSIQEFTMVPATPDAPGTIVVNPGPEVPPGPKASIMSLTTRFPGEAWNASQYWSVFSSGTDTISQWPTARWELEPYYEEGADSLQTGKSYTCHGGFVSEQQINQLDNEFFGISPAEARAMIPGQKMSLEVGYACLVSAGFDNKSLEGRRINCWYGDCGPDWGSFQESWAFFNPGVNGKQMLTSCSNAATSSRISYLFGLKGTISSYDTACSASLVAMNAAHLLMFKHEVPSPDDSEALVVGVNTLLGPYSFIGNCMATMLSHVGRCFTFNRAADGYQRGEGCGAVFVKVTGGKDDEESQVAALIGTATNQDGRSASLTAPNGPAQQAVIRKSLAFARINPNTVSIAECHGTGTALGDPIEVGALMAVMHDREFPLCKTSAKSNIAHLEAGAGIAGLTKCIMMINMATAPPNCHFNVINAHLMVEGYPVIFDTECIDIGFSSLCCGVSSFGFGGTNSRADVYGNSTKGHKVAIRVALPRPTPPRILPVSQPLYALGTWNDWASDEPMSMDRFGEYTCEVVLGHSRREEFQIALRHSMTSSSPVGADLRLHPVVAQASATKVCQVIGPDANFVGLNFVINGEEDGATPGAIYKIRCLWTEMEKSVRCELLET